MLELQHLQNRVPFGPANDPGKCTAWNPPVARFDLSWLKGSFVPAQRDRLGKVRALRESMAPGFAKLTGASRIIKAEVELKSAYEGIDAGSKLVVYPSIGKIILRSSLEGGDLNGFINALGKDLALAS